MVETAEAEEIVELRKQLLQEYRQIKDNMAKINDLIVLFNTDVLPPLAERLRDLEPKFTTVHSVFELAVYNFIKKQSALNK